MKTKNWAIALFSATIAVVAVVSTASAETVEVIILINLGCAQALV